jgi:hypothetical protein
MSRVSVAALAVFVLSMVACQIAWPDTPTTVPARYALIMPPGMQQVTVAGRTVVCPPQFVGDADSALSKITAATPPTTTASDLLERLAQSRAILIAQMSQDLSVPKDKVVTFLDDKLRPAIQTMADVHAHLYVLVATQKQVTTAIKSGWHAPLFRYNPLADYTFYAPRVLVPADRPMDDVVLWSEVKDSDSDAAISKGTVKTIEDFESGFPLSTGQSAVLQSRNLFINFVAENVVDPLKLPTSSEWFGLGLCGAISCKYTADITDLPRTALAAAISADSPSNPIQSAQQDLLHEFDPSSINAEYMPFYRDAISRKGAAVVQKLLDRAGDAAIAKIVIAVKAHPPADNLELVHVIQGATGVDLTNDLLPPQ